MKRAFVLWQMILVCIIASISTAYAQQPDTTTTHSGNQTDSLRNVTFPATGTGMFLPKPERTIDLAITGGAGYFREGQQSVFQPTANADFFARTSALDLTAGFHWGFSEHSPQFPDPAAESFTLGLRFPIKEAESDVPSGFFLDAALLLIDNGTDSEAFSTGLRAALVARTGLLELRLAGEVRRFPFDGNQFQAWGGIELGVVMNLLREERLAPTPKDSLRLELQYLATSDELEQLDKTTSSEEIDQWQDRFWQARNITGSPRNDARIEYMHRVEVANKKYGSPIQLGVTTDRGRVLLVYGTPDRVEAANSLNGSDRKYELWIDQNRIQGYRVAFFLFVYSDFSGSQSAYEGHGEFREIYSNIPSEPSEGIPTDLPPSMYNYIESFR